MRKYLILAALMGVAFYFGQRNPTLFRAPPMP